MPRKGCTTNLLETLDLITHLLAEGNSVDQILLDLAKAFDMVPHGRLIHKLAGYGVCDGMLEWFGDFLRSREQRVVLGRFVSDWCRVLSGVPQGSVLRSLLFIFIHK